jgi:hypothetical protein
VKIIAVTVKRLALLLVLYYREAEERKEEIWKRVAEAAVRNYGAGNGLIRMNNESICGWDKTLITIGQHRPIICVGKGRRDKG